MLRRTGAILTLLSALLLVAVPPAAAEEPAPPERVAAFKRSLQENQGRLRRYEWIETTVVSVKGDPKSNKQNRCYYGADGRIQKVQVGASQPSSAPRGPLRGRIAAKKKEEMSDYIERATSTVHLYVPPDPDMIQKAKEAGTISLHPLGEGRARLEIRDYVALGDLLAVELDLATNRILNIRVSTFLESREDRIDLDVAFATLEDGTSYAVTSTLTAPSKEIRVVVENSGYRAVGR